MIDLKELQAKSWRISEEHGFHDAMLNLPPKVLATYLKMLLTIGEIIEATEELRDGREFTEIYYEYKLSGMAEDHYISPKPWGMLWTDTEGRTRFDTFDITPAEPPDQTVSFLIVPGKPCGIPIELADAQIRLADLCEDIGVDLSEAVQMKERYNEQREFMHGKTA